MERRRLSCDTQLQFAGQNRLKYSCGHQAKLGGSTAGMPERVEQAGF